MKAIWKFELNGESQAVSMPMGAKILTAQAQGANVVLWALVDPNAVYEYRTFYLYYTGWVDEEVVNQSYISTFQFSNGIVVHVFEKI